VISLGTDDPGRCIRLFEEEALGHYLEGEPDLGVRLTPPDEDERRADVLSSHSHPEAGRATLDFHEDLHHLLSDHIAHPFAPSSRPFLGGVSMCLWKQR